MNPQDFSLLNQKLGRLLSEENQLSEKFPNIFGATTPTAKPDNIDNELDKLEAIYNELKTEVQGRQDHLKYKMLIDLKNLIAKYKLSPGSSYSAERDKWTR